MLVTFLGMGNSLKLISSNVPIAAAETGAVADTAWHPAAMIASPRKNSRP